VGVFPSTPYFDSLIDDFGIWQHTDGEAIIPNEGYALDDATRGLLLTLALGRKRQSEVLFSYIIKSKKQDGFYGFVDSSRRFVPGFASDDAIGQVVWAAGYSLSKNFHNNEAMQLITNITSYFDKTEHMRGIAYALLGAIYVGEETSLHFYNKLLLFFDKTDENWPWPESKLTYGNGIIPYAFLRYGFVYGDKHAVRMGRKTLLFLEKCCTHDRRRGPIGNDGWLSQSDTVVPLYSQQPIDAAYMAWAWLVAYQISGDDSDIKLAKAWMKWFEGDNIVNGVMYDKKTMKAFDGINQIGAQYSDARAVNYHSGAESNICLLLSKYMLSENVTI